MLLTVFHPLYYGEKTQKLPFKNGLLFLTILCLLVSCACPSVEASANGGHSEESPALRLAPFMVHVLDAGAVPGPTGPVSWPDADKGVPNATTHDSDIQSGCKHTARTKRDLATGGKQEVKDIMNLFKEGKEKIKLFSEYKNIILVLGNSGVGKTSFVKWMTDDSSKLISVRASTTSGVFLMKDDDDKIGTSTTESKTLFPELFIHKKTGFAYYDLPGFLDTRGPAYDIAVAYFIKKVVDHAKSVKMVFLVDYNSLTAIGSRSEFTDFIVSTTNFVKDITKFQKSIAIIATKVKREFEGDLDDASNPLHVVEDDVYINNVGNFIKVVRNVSLERSPQSLADKNIIKFTDALLEKKGQNFSKIGIFRLAYKAGPFSNMYLLKKGRTNVEKMIKTNLAFTEKTDNDFGYTVSSQSLVYLYDLAEEISTNIQSYVSIVANTVGDHYSDLAEQICDDLNSFITDTNTVDQKISKVRESLDKFMKAPAAVSNLVAELKNVNNPSQLSEKINRTITSLGINVPSSVLSNIADQGGYLYFVFCIHSNTSPKKITMKQWDNLFNDIAANLTVFRSHIKDNINNVIKTIEHHIKTDVNISLEAIKEHFSNMEEADDINQLYHEVRKCHDSLLETKKAANNLNPEECVISIQNDVISMNVSTAADFLSNATQYGVYLNFLQEVSSQFKLTTNSFKCADGLEDAIEYFDQSQKWYKFLHNLYNILSEYEVQKNTTAYDITNLGITKYENQTVLESYFRQFLQKVYSLQDYLNYDDTKDVKLDRIKINSLSKMLNYTLKHKVVKVCSGSELVIKGHYVILSGYKSVCSTAKSIKIFALNTIFIDTDLDRAGEQVELSIIAPTWDIIGTRNIILDGEPGKAHYPTSADSGIYEYGKLGGAHGKHGLAGGPGGNFLGIGKTFKNAQYLTVSSNGGKGGPGQNGGDGLDGPKPEMTYSDVTESGDRFYQYSDPNMAYSTYYGTICNNIFYCDVEKFSKGYFFTPDEYYYRIHSDGGKGGNGGNGGRVGNPGHISIVGLNCTTPNIVTRARPGDRGLGGEGGKGGKNGKTSDLYRWEWLFFGNTHRNYGDDDTIASSGYPGIDNFNISEETAATYSEPGFIINDYKEYLRENLSGSLRKSSLNEFLDLLEHDTSKKSCRS